MDYIEQIKTRASALIQHRRLGTVELVQTVTAAGGNEWDPPTTTSTYIEVPAVVVGIGHEYAASNSNLQSTDLSVTTVLPDTPQA